MKEIKDEELTYEELTTLCIKQEERIRELERMLTTPSETEKFTDEPAKPDYDELCRQNDYLNRKLWALIDENNALRGSLTRAYREITNLENSSNTWEEDYYKEHKRAEKLYDEWKKLKERTK